MIFFLVAASKDTWSLLVRLWSLSAPGRLHGDLRQLAADCSRYHFAGGALARVSLPLYFHHRPIAVPTGRSPLHDQQLRLPCLPGPPLGSTPLPRGLGDHSRHRPCAHLAERRSPPAQRPRGVAHG